MSSPLRTPRSSTATQPPTQQWAIEAVDLVKSYPGGRDKAPVRALDGLSLRVRPGEVFGLLGPNGAGKSTTVRILATLTMATSGRAMVAGHDVQRAPDDVRRAIGLVSQKPSSAPIMTGRESIELAGRIQGLSRREARSRAADLLEQFGLADAANRLTKTYSGGMTRRLDVAVGLANRPAVLFLDEPTTGLDPEARAQLWTEIRRLSTVDRTTILLTTHYLDEADELADRLAIVDHGRVVAEGSPDELKRELKGDTVAVELADPVSGPVAAQRLARIPGLSEVTQVGATLRARTDQGARAIPAVLASLEQAGLTVASATVARPSLDDVYRRHAGRAFDGAA
ncbi:MAG TPA: ATP-binding cassette domain-containing protein [Candidatus Lustribacter sp.]|nr:ATP-binding cassette domain-containing protein [Candidatus Lustribacter sp.]